jgi:type III secretion protein V
MADAATLKLPSGLSRFNDLGLAGLVVAVIVMMALPLPAWLIDVLVAINISIGVTLLLVALYVPSPLAFSTLPAVLLITTLFRISLNVATTRQILMHAHAGDIIEVFGRTVVGGSLIVGLVVFLIITVVQFIVVAKGAERVAEVCARFTLDALPGRQMSIDADMRSGVITQADAVARRQELTQESHFFGAMDGAMKFVKGDAIAGIVIVLINLLGGIAIGTLVMDLGFANAVRKFSVLTIGDGLVTQIPALFVSIAAGIAITRTAPDSSSNLGEQIGRQIGGQPRALLLASVVMVLFATVPGLPKLTFILLAAAVALTALALSRRQISTLLTRSRAEIPAACRDGDATPVTLADTSQVRQPWSPFRLQLGTALAESIGASGLNQALARERQALREEYGIPFPGVVPQRSSAIDPNGFVVLVQDLPDAAVVVPAGAALVLGPPSSDVANEASTAFDIPPPALLMPCRWVAQASAQTLAGTRTVQVLTPAEVVARTVVRVMQHNASATLGVQEVRQLLREIEGRFPDLVRESQSLMPLPRLADMMAALARERVPLFDLPSLLQGIVTQGPNGAADPPALFEACRMSLARSIVARQMELGSDRLAVVALEPELENRLRASLTMRPDGPVFALPTSAAEAIQNTLVEAFQAMASKRQMTLLVPADLRRASSRLFRAVLPRCAWISHDELAATGVQPEVVFRAKLPRGA